MDSFQENAPSRRSWNQRLQRYFEFLGNMKPEAIQVAAQREFSLPPQRGFEGTEKDSQRDIGR